MRLLIVLSTFAIAYTYAFANSIPLKCWIVNDDSGTGHWSSEAVFDIINKVNSIYTQVCMSFSITSVSNTNSTFLSAIYYENHIQWTRLCDIERNTGGLELYFVEEI